jgi:ABC-type branched-subunit amino acid transport system substrate-binding protein
LADGSGIPVATGPVIVAPGDLSDADEREAAQLWEAAQGSFDARRFFEVLRTTEELIQRFPASDVSGEALRLMARTELQLGRTARADQAAGRYVALLQPGDSRATEMRLLQAAALASDPAGQLDRLLRIDDGASDDEIAAAASLVRESADALAYDQLRRVVDGVGPAAGPLAPIAEARLAVALLEFGQGADASIYARRAIDDGAQGEELLWSEGVLRGELPEGRGRETAFSIGLVLPFGGPPALADFAALVQEGVEVAVSTALGEEYTVNLLVRDDEGDPERTAQAISELEAQGVAGVIGMLQDEVLVSAGQARSTGLPLVSPTARSAARSGEGVYSLEGSDPEAAQAVARYAVSRAFQRIAIVLPQTPEAAVEASAFEAVAEALGMPVVGRFAYEAGATFFEPQIRAARDALRRDELRSLQLMEDDTLHMEVLEPTAIFLPIPPEDVEFLAPQLIHFGLDTLAIELLGTSGWTDPQTLEVVDSRHTTGVVATAAVDAGAGSAGDLRFRDAYEEIFQRSLVGGTASLGYDAALVLLEALRPGRVAPDEVTRSMARLSGVEGATGVFSVIDGRVVRATGVVRIQDRRAVPEPAGWPASLDVVADSILPGGAPFPSDVAQPVDTGVVVDTVAIPSPLVPSSNH